MPDKPEGTRDATLVADVEGETIPRGLQPAPLALGSDHDHTLPAPFAGASGSAAER